jgi:hypothetical protein
MRDLAQIDADFRLLGAVWWSIRENGGELSSRQIDELLDEKGRAAFATLSPPTEAASTYQRTFDGS